MTRSVDELLVEHGFGRAHHRALYFIARQPGLPVSAFMQDPVDRKQSLGRVLNDLSARGLVETRAGAGRAAKLLRLTEAGAAFEAQLFDALRRSVGGLCRGRARSVTGFWRVLEGLIPEDERQMVMALQRRGR
ncbi:MAG: MarR family transcriptional regulator [Rhodospirillaceae bacterium]|nr:MarR family transcriptional regulator [Rhodospirillaceae bacterium]